MTALSARRRAWESSLLADPESLGTRTRGAFAAGGITKTFVGASALALGVAGIQLFVPVLRAEPVARWTLTPVEDDFGVGFGAALGALTVGMRTIFVPLELRPKEVEPVLTRAPVEMGMRVTLEEPSETEEPLVLLAPLVLAREDELLGREELPREGLMMDPMEGLLPLELLPLELLPRETLPLELLLPLWLLLWEALDPLEPRWASTGTSRTKRMVAKAKESRRSCRIAFPYSAVRMWEGHPEPEAKW